MQRILAIARKELLLFAQKPATWIMIFLAPLVFIWIVSSVFGISGTPVVSIFAVNEDGGPGGERAMAALRSAENLRVEELEVREEADRRVGAGERMAAIIIPAGFTDTIKLPDGARIDLIVDPARAEQANIVIGLAHAALGPLMVEAEVSRGVEGGIVQMMENIRASEEEAPPTEGGPPPLGGIDPSTGSDFSPTTDPSLIFPPSAYPAPDPSAFLTETPDPSLEGLLTETPDPSLQGLITETPDPNQPGAGYAPPSEFQPVEVTETPELPAEQPGEDLPPAEEAPPSTEQPETTNPLLKFLTAALDGVISNQVQQAAEDPLVQLNVLPVGGALRRPSLLDSLAPGYSLLFVFFLVASLAGTVVEERQTGALRRLLVSPVPRSSILLGKMLPYFVIAILQLSFVLLASRLLFGIRLGDDPLALLILIFAVSAVVAALGILVAALVRSASQASGLAVVVALAMAVVSGAMFPGVAVPGLQALTPHYWAMQGFLNVIARGQGLYGALGPAGILIVFAAVFFVIGVIRFRFD